MPRKPRYEEAGAVHHVWARGVDKRSIFMCDLDRRLYLLGLCDVVEERNWALFGYCLMTNHIHLLVRTSEPNLGLGMQELHSRYAQDFNQRLACVGHLFQDRFGSSRVRTDG